jgi:FtsX-like permease family
MRFTAMWTQAEWRRRWRSLTALALLVALSTATVLAAIAGARRGQTAYERLWARTLPATITVLPNQPGFDWARIRSLPEVSALTTFAVSGFWVGGYPLSDSNTSFPFTDRQFMRAIERPVVFQGRLFNPARPDEVVVTPGFPAHYGKGVGDTLTLRMATPQQIDQGYDPSSGGQPGGPRVRVRIVGVVRSIWFSDQPSSTGAVIASPALFTRYRVDIMGRQGHVPLNALVRLKGGEGAIPAFRAELARVTGRPDIDVWDNADFFGGPIRRVTGYEAACLLAFGLTALTAAILLIGQSLARSIATTVSELQVLRAAGVTPGQVIAAAAAAPFLAAVAGASGAVAVALVASRWMPIGAASLLEPRQGIIVDWPILGIGWAAVPLLTLAGSAAAAARMLATGRARRVPRRSAIAAATAAAGLAAPVVIGTRFALEPGEGRSSVPVRPALAGAVAGVLGVLAAFTFSAGVSDAAANPVRFGQTNQLEGWLGFNGQDFGPSGLLLPAIAADRGVIGLNNGRIAVAQSGQTSITAYTYAPVAGKRLPVVLTAGRMPATAREVVLAPTTADRLHARAGSAVRLTGTSGTWPVTVSGIGFVPEGPHNTYDTGAWITPAGYDRLFAGAHFAFKFHITEVTLRPGADVNTVARRLDAVARGIPGGQQVSFAPPAPPGEIQVIKDVAVLPLALGGFLALLAAGAVGHALATAVRRRRHELAVLRALGMTRRQVRFVLVTQASLLALIGLGFGIPLGIALGRITWRLVAQSTPLAYHAPLAIWALALIGPLAVLAANMLAAWPGQRAARLRSAQVLRAE